MAPGGPEEDTDEGFDLGGWTAGYFHEFIGETVGEQEGEGSSSFGAGAMSTGFRLLKSESSPSSVTVTSCESASEIKLGTYGQ